RCGLALCMRILPPLSWVAAITVLLPEPSRHRARRRGRGSLFRFRGPRAARAAEHHARQPRPHATAAWGHASIYGASLSAAARGRARAATPPALPEDRPARRDPRGQPSAAASAAP